MSDPKSRKILGDLRGGRNGTDPPVALAENQVVDAVNVDWWHTTFANKRNGLSAASTTFSSGGPFTGKVSSLFRHVPGTDETAAEIWGVDDAATPVVGRKASATNFVAPTLKDAIIGNGWDLSWATLAGKLFAAYKAASGFSAPAAPTVANTGAGTYAAVQRYYRVRWITVSNSVTQRRSPVGASSTGFTPSGTGAAARVTRPAAPGTGETHWELEVSYDNVSFRVLYGDGGISAAVAIGTTTADDSTTLNSSTLTETFTSSATWTRPSWVTSVTYLIVGGGGNGAANSGGAGGGGRVLTGTDSIASATYPIVVGGAASSSSFNSHTATAGSAGTGAGGAGGASGSGHTGGTGASCFDGGSYGTGGGGAGDSANGSNADCSGGGNGGAGTSSSISGSAVTYGGGGGGGGSTQGTGHGANGVGGAGGGGNGGGQNGNGVAGTANRGGGGGGGGSVGSGGAGGSGIVILSYSAALITNAGLSQSELNDRLHVWDGFTLRRAGFAAPVAPTVANTGAGAYAATLRYYRVRWVQQSGGVTIRRSEASASVSFTPSGSGTAARVTQPAVPNEGETHWELEGSSDNVTFYILYGDNGKSGSAVAIATTTADDSVAPASYSTGTNTSASTGTYTAQKAYKYLAADQNRVLGFGAWNALNKQNRLEISAVVVSAGDEERVDTNLNYYVDFDESDSGTATGLVGPALGGAFFPFKDKQTYQLTPTGTPTAPYKRVKLSAVVGSVPGAQCVGEDAYGNAAVYWMSHRGPHRYSASRGLEYIGHGIADLILGPTSTVNLTATNVIARIAYHLEKRQIWLGVATGSSNDPNTLLMFDVVHAERTRDETGRITGGWSRVPSSDVLANLRALAMLPTTIGVTMSRDLKPYIGSATTANAVYKCDDSSATDDAGTAFQAYLQTRPIEPGGAGFNGAVGEAVLLAKSASNVTITASVTANFDPTRVQTGTCSLTPDGSETRLTRILEGSAFGESVSVVQYQIGDSEAVSNSWSVDRLTIPYQRQEAQSG